MAQTRFLGSGLVMGLALGGLVLLAAAQTGGDRPDGYHVTGTVALPGGGWDYLGIDTPARRLYVSASTQEDVLDADTLKLVGTVADLKGTHGVAISDQDGHGFTSNGGGNSMTMFDLKTLAAIKEIPLPIQRPDGIIYDPATDRVFAFNHARAPEHCQAVAVDAKTGAVVGTIELPGEASEYAVADGRGHVYNNMEDTSVELEIDARTLKITQQWPLAPCKNPSGLDMDRKTRRLVIGCHNGMMAFMNADTGAIVATVPIGGGVDANRFDPALKLAFSSNGGGRGADGAPAPATITVAHEDGPDHWTVVGNIPTEAGARTMEVDTKTHRLFTVTAKYEPPPPQPAGAQAAAGGRGRGFRRQMVPGSFHLIVISK
ncbi:MAG: YncE family protein [Terriglobales bacterium]